MSETTVSQTQMPTWSRWLRHLLAIVAVHARKVAKHTTTASAVIPDDVKGYIADMRVLETHMEDAIAHELRRARSRPDSPLTTHGRNNASQRAATVRVINETN